MEPGLRDRENTVPSAVYPAKVAAAMEPGLRDRENLADSLRAVAAQGRAAMEPGMRDRENPGRHHHQARRRKRRNGARPERPGKPRLLARKGTKCSRRNGARPERPGKLEHGRPGMPAAALPQWSPA